MNTIENQFNRDEIYDKVKFLVEESSLEKDASMSDYTSFRTGGKVALLIRPSGLSELFSSIEILNREKAPFLVMGNGSNLLFQDEGYAGAAIRVGEGIDGIRVAGNVIFAEAGALLSTVAKVAMEHSLSGLEFASGIPGSVGGAVFMNAGAYGGEMKDVLLSVSAMQRNGMMKDRKAAELELGYRDSIFQRCADVIIGAKLLLKEGNQGEIKARMKELCAKRNEKQPVNLPSAGSFFKRPAEGFAGSLIEKAGLKGLQLGGAQVSPLHGGFIVNTGGATATDIINLMTVVQNTVYDQFGVRLLPEVRII